MDILDLELITHGCGVLALCVGLFATQCKNPRTYLYVQCVPALLWMAHFGLLHEIPGVIIAFAAFCRNLFGAKLPDTRVMIGVGATLLASSIVVLMSIDNMMDALPMAAGLALAVAVYYRHKGFRFRVFNIAGQAVWLGYALMIESHALALSASLMMASLAISVGRHDLKSAFRKSA